MPLIGGPSNRPVEKAMTRKPKKLKMAKKKQVQQSCTLILNGKPSPEKATLIFSTAEGAPTSAFVGTVLMASKDASRAPGPQLIESRADLKTMQQKNTRQRMNKRTELRMTANIVMHPSGAGGGAGGAVGGFGNG